MRAGEEEAHPQVLVFVPYPRPKTATPSPASLGAGAQRSGGTASAGHVIWTDELDRKLWSCASLYPHNSVKWDVVARKLNVPPDQCIIRFLHLYQQQLHRQLLAQHKPRTTSSGTSSPAAPHGHHSGHPSIAQLGSGTTERLSSSPSGGLAGSPSGSFGHGPSSARGGQAAVLSSSPSTSQHGFPLSSSPTSLFPGYLSSSPSSQAPLFSYAAKHGVLASPVGSPASSLLARPKSGEHNLAKISWPSRQEFFDCVKRHNFEWLSIGRALKQNPYECRQMYLALTEDGKRAPTDIERYDAEAPSDNPFHSDFALYDEDRRSAPQLFQPLHEGSTVFALDDDSPEPLRRSTLLSKQELAAAAAAAATGSLSGLSLLHDEEEQDSPSWLPSSSIDQSTLASAFMSTFLNRDSAVDSSAE